MRAALSQRNMTKKSENKLDIEKTLARLDEIASLMAEPKTTVDESLVLLKEASLLASRCAEDIKNAELEVRECRARFDEAFSDGEDIK